MNYTKSIPKQLTKAFIPTLAYINYPHAHKQVSKTTWYNTIVTYHFFSRNKWLSSPHLARKVDYPCLLKIFL